jgi:transcriptional regulator with XRE-family HTH domain
MSFGETLHLARRRAGLTQTQLAAILGLSKQYICNLERGHRSDGRRLSVDHIGKLPPEIRSPVALYVLREWDDEMRRLREWVGEAAQ